MKQFKYEELTDLDISKLKEEDLPAFMDALMSSDRGIASICTVLVRTASVLDLMPAESLDKVIKIALSQDLNGTEEEYRDNVVAILKVIQEIKPKLATLIKPMRETLKIRDSIENESNKRV